MTTELPISSSPIDSALITEIVAPSQPSKSRKRRARLNQIAAGAIIFAGIACGLIVLASQAFEEATLQRGLAAESAKIAVQLAGINVGNLPGHALGTTSPIVLSRSDIRGSVSDKIVALQSVSGYDSSSASDYVTLFALESTGAVGAAAITIAGIRNYRSLANELNKLASPADGEGDPALQA